MGIDKRVSGRVSASSEGGREETTVVMHDRMYTYDSGRPSAFMPSRKGASATPVASSLSLHAASAHNNSNSNHHNAHHMCDSAHGDIE